MRRGHWIAFTLIFMTAWSSTLLARTPINETRSADPEGSVTIENLIGSVTVVGWNKNEISIKGTLGEGPEELSIDTEDDEISIVVVWPKRTFNRKFDSRNSDTDLEISIPLGSEVWVEGVNTAIDISGVDGEIAASSVNGDIKISGGSGEVEAETVNGSIEIDTSAETVEAETVNGIIVIKGNQEEVSASTVNGSIEITGESLDSGEFSSVSGDIVYTGNMTKRGSFDFESHSGSITLNLPAGVSADFDVETFSGKIINELGPKAEKVSKYGPGYELSFSTGSGSAQVSISSFSGRVEIREQ